MTETKVRNLVIEGRGPLLIGLRAVLQPGQTIKFGRSRECNLSLRRGPAFAAARDPADLLSSKEFNRVSRVHCEISHLPDGRLWVNDLSNNGTWVRGTKVNGSVTVSVDGQPVEIAPVEGDLGTLVVKRS